MSDIRAETERSVSRPDYRAELFGAGDCEEAPFWLAVEKPDGTERTDGEAANLVDDYWGESEEPWKVSRVQMYVGRNEYGDLRVHPKPDGMDAGPFDFWRFEELVMSQSDSNDTKFGLIEGVPPDEPCFVLRGKDLATLTTLVRYEQACRTLGSPGAHLEAIAAAYRRIAEWQARNPDALKVPD